MKGFPWLANVHVPDDVPYYVMVPTTHVCCRFCLLRIRRRKIWDHLRPAHPEAGAILDAAADRLDDHSRQEPRREAAAGDDHAGEEAMSEPTPTTPTKEQLKAAFKAFKKRLKLTRLDEESRLGRNPATSGRPSDIVAITPPAGFPPEVWDELVRQGKLRRDRHGTYELAGG